jgi:hypothetical protein
MLTIFAAPKPFQNHIKTIQNNAIKSWLQLQPACEVVLLGNEAGTAETASGLGIKHIPDVACNEFGTPLINSIFNLAQSVARTRTMCYVNADIILLSDFITAVQRVNKEKFLVVGQRWDIELDEPINFSDERWESRLKDRVAAKGKLHPASGSDYFVFPRGLFTDIPAFALGRPGWDNWMIYRARSLKIPVIDATREIAPVHQAHDYSHVPQGKPGTFEGPEARRNAELIGGWEYSLSPRHATWRLTPHGLKRNLTIKSIYYRVVAMPVLHARLRFLFIPKRIVMALSRAFKSKPDKNGGK